MNQLPLDIPLKNFHQNNGAKILPFAGFNMPINYKTGIINEHKNVRSHSGIFDVSHMGQILIENIESIKIDRKPRSKLKPSDHTPIELIIN